MGDASWQWPFRSTYTVIVTPFEARDRVDVAALVRFVDWQIEDEIHGLIPLGSTSEFLSPMDEERMQVAETVIRRSAGHVPVLV